MRGKVLYFSDVEATGTISGDDGIRYTFTRGDLQSGARDVRQGADVDFTVEDGAAKQIFVTSPLEVPGDKSKIAAALLAFFLGGLGIHKFYLGRTGAGFICLLCGTLGWLLLAIPPAIIGIICIIEAILYISKSDEQFYRDYVVNKKEWF